MNKDWEQYIEEEREMGELICVWDAKDREGTMHFYPED